MSWCFMMTFCSNASDFIEMDKYTENAFVQFQKQSRAGGFPKVLPRL